MANKAQDLFNSILSEADRLEKALLTLDELPNSEAPASVVGLVNVALKSIEGVLLLLIKNTDLQTNDLNKEFFDSIDRDEVKQQLQRIGILARRIEREIA